MMQAGQQEHDMQTFNQSLVALYFRRKISYQTALRSTSMPEELEELIHRGPESAGLHRALGPPGPASGRNAAHNRA